MSTQSRQAFHPLPIYNKVATAEVSPILREATPYHSNQQEMCFSLECVAEHSTRSFRRSGEVTQQIPMTANEMDARQMKPQHFINTTDRLLRCSSPLECPLHSPYIGHLAGLSNRYSPAKMELSGSQRWIDILPPAEEDPSIVCVLYLPFQQQIP